MTDLFPLQQIADQAELDSWTPVNLNTLPDKPPIEPILGGSGLLYPGKRHVFSGPPESAKTLAAYTMLILVARTGNTGILIDFEMGSRDAKQRLQELGATPDEIDRIPYLEPDTPATPARLSVLIDLQPELVVIDAAAGAYQAEGLDDNKRSDVERFSRLYIGAFWLKGIATIVIDHVIKNVETRGKFAIGSERKLGSSDVHLGFDTIQPISRGTNGRYKITTHKDRGGCLKRGHLANLELDSDQTTHQIGWTYKAAEQVDETAPFRPTTLMERVSRYLEISGEPLSVNQITTGIKGHNDKAKRAAIDALVREGYAHEEAGARGSRNIKFTKVFLADDAALATSADFGGLRPAEVIFATSADLSGPQPAEVTTTSAPHPFRGGPAEVVAEDNGHDLSGATQGWFTEDGAYFDTIAPDQDEDT